MLDEAKNAAEFNDYLRNVVYKFYTQTNLPVPKPEFIIEAFRTRQVLGFSGFYVTKFPKKHLGQFYKLDKEFYAFTTKENVDIDFENFLFFSFKNLFCQNYPQQKMLKRKFINVKQ